MAGDVTEITRRVTAKPIPVGVCQLGGSINLNAESITLTSRNNGSRREYPWQLKIKSQFND